MIPPERTRPLIRDAARRAVERAQRGELTPYTALPARYEIEVELREPVGDTLRENLARLPEFSLSNECTVCTRADDMDIGLRRIAYLSFAHSRSITRY